MSNRTSLPPTHINSSFNYDKSNNTNRKHTLTRANTEPQPSLMNSSNELENQRIYLNQLNDCHQYASIDLEDSIISESNENERV